MLSLDSDAVRRILPHRDPFLFVDEVPELVPGQRAVGIKEITPEMPVFLGHFPDYPIFPGVLTLEALAQVGAVAVLYDRPADLGVLAGVDRARLRRPVEPPARLRLEVSIVKMRGRIGKGFGQAFVGDEMVAEAELMFALQPRSATGVR